MKALLWLPRFVSLLLVGLLAAILAWWVPRLSEPRPAIAPVQGNSSGLASDPTVAARLFGALPVAAQSAVTLNFRVAGLVSGKRGAALIATDGGTPRSVALGEEVASGWVLVEVEPDRVTLERNGSRSELATPTRPTAKLLTGSENAAVP